MAGEIAFAAPRTEEMTRVVAGAGGAGVTGVVEGMVVKMAPQMGALEPMFTWGSLLGIPLIATGLSLFTRGLLGDLFMGAACGGLGILGYVGPEMLVPVTGRRPTGGGTQLPLGSSVKQLPAGPLDAPQRAQAAARAATLAAQRQLGSGNPGPGGYIPIITDETVLV